MSQNSEIKPSSFLCNTSTFTDSVEKVTGDRQWIGSVNNQSTSTVAHLTKTYTWTFEASVTGGFDIQVVKATVGFKGAYTNTTTITVDVKPRNTANIYLVPNFQVINGHQVIKCLGKSDQTSYFRYKQATGIKEWQITN